MSRPRMPNSIRVGVPFIINRGNRKAKYKIAPHPYIPGAYALIADHPWINYNYFNQDIDNIINGSNTIERTWEQAYYHT